MTALVPAARTAAAARVRGGAATVTPGSRYFGSTGRTSSHDNPLDPPPRPRPRDGASSSRFPEPSPGLPRSGAPPPLPTRGLPAKRRISHVRKVVVVASGKGGVGKSTVAANLAVGMAMNPQQLFGSERPRKPRIGLLDLDIFGPSVPTLLNLKDAGSPELTRDNALVPMENHGVKCMSIDFLTSKPGKKPEDTPVAWRGMMVMKAVQQLLFDVDWRGKARADGAELPDLDVLVIDMPPGTGDVALSLGQLVECDGALIVSTPQEVALLDARKGVAMFKAVSIPILGLVLNMSHFDCTGCGARHAVFGTDEAVRLAAREMGTPVVGEVPIETATSARMDRGRPVVLGSDAGTPTAQAFADLTETVWAALHQRATPRVERALQGKVRSLAS